MCLIMEPDEALAFLKQGAAQIISEDELREKLAGGRPLRVKLGVDPTSPDIHLGHSIVLRKLRQFQDLGHQAVLIIGDFTGMIGDASGRSATRPQLTHKEIMANAATYRDQAFKILDPARTETVCNGDWFRAMSFEDVIRLNSRVTLQQMLQREDFRARIDNRQSIRSHEIQYPIMQGWDSVQVQADVELGGTDQLFNNLVGRDLQKEEGQPQQVVLLVPILEGLDGVQKMSKSLGNAIGIKDAPLDMYGKVMSVSDALMWRYYELLTDVQVADIENMKRESHPMDAKKDLARRIVTDFHSADAAAKAKEDWAKQFQNNEVPDDVEEVTIEESKMRLDKLLARVGLADSVSDAVRKVKQKAVKVNGEVSADPAAQIDIHQSITIQAGRKIKKVRAA